MALLDRALVRLLPAVPKPVVQKLSSHYIAGSELSDACRVVKELNDDGKMATIDVLGEEVTNADEARAIVGEYRQALEWDSGRWGFGSDAHDFAALTGDWDAQLDLTWLIGLLLRGWRKGLDAEAAVTLGSGVSAAEDLAWWCERAVEAADRRL